MKKLILQGLSKNRKKRKSLSVERTADCLYNKIDVMMRQHIEESEF
jgi:hypothetical protein